MRASAFPVAFLLAAALAPLPAQGLPVCIREEHEAPYYDATVGEACGPDSVLLVEHGRADVTLVLCLDRLDGSLPECETVILHCPRGQCWLVRSPVEAVEDLLASRA